MLVYDQTANSDATATNLWTKETLISIREFEKDVKKVDRFEQVCLAQPISSSSVNAVQCVDAAF